MKCLLTVKDLKKRSGKQGYLFTVYDYNREVLATILSEKRNSEVMIVVFKIAVEEEGFYTRIISTFNHTSNESYLGYASWRKPNRHRSYSRNCPK